MLIAALPLTAYNFALRLDLIPNVFSSVTLLAGDRPSLSEDGWLKFFWYVQKVSIINGIVSIIVFGWLNALALTLCAFIVLDWEEEKPTRLSHSIRRLLPPAIFVWGILIVTKVCSLILNAAFILPGLVLVTVWSVAKFAAVDEETGPIQALRKSYTLVRQFFWGVFALVCAFFFIGTVTGLLRSRILKYVLESGHDIQHFLVLDLALREIFSFAEGFASIIVFASTYLVLRRANQGVSDAELRVVFG